MLFNSNDKMKTTCWYEERRNLVGVFDFRSFFYRFFVLVARWRWACFVFLFSWLFLLPGAYPLRNVGVANLVVFLCWPCSCCKLLYVWLFVCFFFILVALHLYIWGNIVLNTCMAFVVIKIVSLVSCFLFVCQRLDSSIR